jgi:hypothetical protein
VRIVLAGSIGRLPVGGYSWMDMQWLAGLSALGHDVHYVEDCGEQSWVYNWTAEQLTTDLDYPGGYVGACLGSIGLGDRWTYRAGDGTRGRTATEVADMCAEADLLIVHGVPLEVWRPEYARIRRKVFVDVDPGFIQIALATGDAKLTETADRCEVLFTIGQRFGAADCPVPTAGRTWLPTRPPVALQHWPVTEGSATTHFTCVMQWRGFREVEWNGVRYGQKDREFPRFLDLPTRTSQDFRIALTGAAPEELTGHGWDVVPGWEVSETPWTYQRFIQWSRAEFGVAKHGYVAMRGGWVSDRTLCYLASGRPALVQETGASEWLPVGKGLLTFDDPGSALAGIDAINDDYAGHCAAARALAEEYFSAARVLPLFLERAVA